MGTILCIAAMAIVLALCLGAIGYGVDNSTFSKRKNAELSFLPGDIKYESPNGNFKFYLPITTSIVVSLVLSLLLRLFG